MQRPQAEPRAFVYTLVQRDEFVTALGQFITRQRAEFEVSRQGHDAFDLGPRFGLQPLHVVVKMVPRWIDVKQHLWVEFQRRPALVLDLTRGGVEDGLVLDHDHPRHPDAVQTMRLKNGFGQQSARLLG